MSKLTGLSIYNDEFLVKSAVSARKAALASGVEKPIRATPFVFSDPVKLPRRPWIYGGHFQRRELSASLAPGGTGKSSHSLVEALAMVSGKPLLGEMATKKYRVWYINGEDDDDELRRRVTAAMLHYRLAPEDIGDRLFVDTADGDTFSFAKEDRNVTKIIHSTSDAVIENIRLNNIDVVIIDPVISFHSLDGNVGKQIQPFVTELKRIAKLTNVAFEIVGHTRKGTGDGKAATQDDAMGSVAFVNKTRSSRIFVPLSYDEGAKAGLTPSEAARIFKITNPKHTNSAGGAAAKYRMMVSVDLGNSGHANGGSMLDFADQVGVATQWRWPDAATLAEDVTAAELEAIKAALDGYKGRESYRSASWAGTLVLNALGLDGSDKALRPKAHRLLEGLLKSGELKIAEAENPTNRHLVNYIVPA